MGCGTDSGVNLRCVPHLRNTALLRSFRTTRSYLGKSSGSRCTKASTLARFQSGDCVLQQGPLSRRAGPRREKLNYLYTFNERELAIPSTQVSTQDIPLQ